MLYAVVSDVHANLPAWKAVLADLTSLGAGRILCLGDVVGYGPEPAAVLSSMYRHADAFVMGNHDAALCGRLDPAGFNRHARTMVEWSAQRVSARGKAFLARQSLVLTAPDFVCVHGDLALPGAFQYILKPDDALATWRAGAADLVFVGHSHIAGLFVLGASGRPHRLTPEDFVVEEGKRFIVNVGSVGYPRDGDARACYCLYDDVERAVRWRRVPFDMDALRKAMQREGLDEERMPLLDHDPVKLRRPVREQLQFESAPTKRRMAQDVKDTTDLATLLRRRMRRWRALAGLSLALGIGALAVVVPARRATERAMPEQPLPANLAHVPAALTGNLVPPLPRQWDGNLLGNWRYRLSHPARQKLELAEADEVHGPRLRVSHERRARLVLEAPPWELNGLASGKLRGRVAVRRGKSFRGAVTMVLDVTERDENGRPIERRGMLHAAPGLRRRNGWMLAQQTTRRLLNAQTESLRFRIEAEFEGQLEIAAPELRLR